MALPIFFDYFTSSNDLCLDIFSNMQALVADRSVTALLTPVQRVAFAQNDTTTAYSFIRHMLAANNQHLFEAVARWVHKNPTQQSLRPQLLQRWRAQEATGGGSPPGPPGGGPPRPPGGGQSGGTRTDPPESGGSGGGTVTTSLPYVLWVCAAYTEYRQARDVLMNKLGVELDSFTVNNWTYETAIATLPAPTRGETQKVKFYLVITPNQGSDGMQLTVSRMMHYLLSLHGPDSAFRLPKAVVSTGFCAGREGKVELGDLCVATSSFNLRAGGKTRDGPVIPGTTRTEMVTDLAARAVDWEPDWQVKIERMKHDWRDPAKLINGVLQPARRNAQGQTWTPKVEPGVFFCDDVVQNRADAFEGPSEVHRKAVAIDMESFAFYKACKDSNVAQFPRILVKTATDYAVRKDEEGDNFQPYGAQLSALFMLDLLEEHLKTRTS